MSFFRNTLKKLRNLRQDYIDQGMNRKLVKKIIKASKVGYDRNGNKYYQYYSDNGEELKREVEAFSNMNAMIVEFDQNWDEWLRGKKKEPYSEDELRKLWDEEDKRISVAMNYEKRDASMMKDYRKEKKEGLDYGKGSDQKGENESFEPGAWNPGSRKNK